MLADGRRAGDERAARGPVGGGRVVGWHDAKGQGQRRENSTVRVARHLTFPTDGHCSRGSADQAWSGLFGDGAPIVPPGAPPTIGRELTIAAITIRLISMNTSLSLRLAAPFALAVFAAPSVLPAVELAVAPIEAGARVTVDGKPFADYVTKSGHQPVIWPIIGPDGQAMTRQYPLGPQLPGEPDDHLHHRSLWFNHGEVNGRDFWMEPDADGAAEENNQIEHRKFVALEAEGATAKIVTSNDWTSGGVKVCEDVRTIEFGADERWPVDRLRHRAEGERGAGRLRRHERGFVRRPRAGDDERRCQARGRNHQQPRRARRSGVGPACGVGRLPRAGRRQARRGSRSSTCPTASATRAAGMCGRTACSRPTRSGSTTFRPKVPQQGDATLAKGETLRLHYRVLLYNGELTPAELEAAYQSWSEAVEK